jgi:hypothetical protein
MGDYGAEGSSSPSEKYFNASSVPVTSRGSDWPAGLGRGS